MKNIGKIIIIIILFLFQQKYILGQKSVIVDSTINLSILQKGLENYLNKIPVGKENDFGFYSRDEFNKIRIGIPVQLYQLSDSEDKKFMPSKSWKVPLIINGSYRSFLDVSLKNGNYQVVGIGLHELAYDLDIFEESYNLKSLQNKALFIDYSLNACFLILHKQADNPEFLPFRPINVLQPKDTYSSNELFEILITLSE